MTRHALSRWPGALAALVPALAVLAATCAHAAAPAEPVSLKDQTRALWARQSADFVREWLVCGEFPNLPEDPTDQAPDVPRLGLATDFLTEHGGEAAITPAPGMKHARPDGSTVEWRTYTSPADILEFPDAFAGQPTEFVVAYAYTTIVPEHAGDAVLAVGSDDGVRIWLNGRLVHDHAIRRGVEPDQDLVPVVLQPGENRILAKVEQGVGGWGLALRLLPLSQARIILQSMLAPSLEPGEGENAGKLIVITNPEPARRVAPNQTVTVEATAAGGRIIASEVVPNGSRVVFDPSAWDDGSYEIICRMTAPDGRELVRYLPWYKGDAVNAARELIAAAASADPNTPSGMIHAMLADMVLHRAGGDLDDVAPQQARQIYGALMEYEELLLDAAGQTGRLRPRGFFRLAYRDPVDDSPQFCRAYLPAHYTPEREWPLIVNLHGYYAANPPYVQWWETGQRHDAAADRDTAIVIHPMGRYNTSYRGLGDSDVVRCIELAKQSFSMDEDRVYLTGYSMGGGGTWHVGTRHPDTFAALGPYYGGWDYRVWLDDDQLARMTDRQRFVADREGSFSQAENLLNVPIWIMHGDSDTVVDPDQSRYAVRVLQRWGYDIRYQEVPGGGHGALGTEEALYAWFLEHQRDLDPRRIRIRSADLEGAATYWANIGQREDPFTFINADIEVVGPNTIRLDTDNVLEVTLSPQAGLVDPSQPLTVVWNGSDTRTVNLDSAGQVTLRADGYQPAGLVKNAQIEGPVSDAQTTPFALVIGTASPHPTMRAFCQRQAQSFIADWERRQHATPRTFKDSEITESEMAQYSLILFGGPDANLVTKKLSDDLPLTITSGEIVIDGHAFPARDAAVKMVYPNPLNPDRYVSIIAATSPKGMSYAARLPNDFDFCIGDGRIADDEGGRPEEKVLVASGSFDHAWRLDPDYMIVGDPDARAQSAVRGAPMHLSAAVDTDRLMLSDLLETKSAGTFAAMMRNLNWRGDPIVLGGKTYSSGIAVNTSGVPNWAEFDISDAGWSRLRGVIGIEQTPEDDTDQPARDNTQVIFIVSGDGKELHRSEPFVWDSAPRELDVDITGVKALRIEVAIGASPSDGVASADWADLRLER